VFVMDIDLQDWTGRVVDDVASVGIAGATVVAHVGDGAGRSRCTAQATTAADGSFALRFARGNASWRVAAPGYPRLESHRRSLDPAHPLELRMVRGHRVTGRVVRDADGAPVGGIGVFSQYRSGSPVSHVVAGPDGRFVFEGLHAGPLSIAAHGDGFTTRGIAKALENADPLAIRPFDTRPAEVLGDACAAEAWACGGVWRRHGRPGTGRAGRSEGGRTPGPPRATSRAQRGAVCATSP